MKQLNNSIIQYIVKSKINSFREQNEGSSSLSLCKGKLRQYENEESIGTESEK